MIFINYTPSQLLRCLSSTKDVTIAVVNEMTASEQQWYRAESPCKRRVSGHDGASDACP